MTKLLFLAIAFCCFTVIPEPAHACGCFPSLPNVSPKKLVLEEKKRSTAVFSGTVISISLSQGAILAVKLKVERTWKYVHEHEIIVFTPASDSHCGFNFEVGQSYLVYASASPQGELWTNHCTRTGRLSIDVNDDLKVLGKGKPPRNSSPKQSIR